MQILTDLNDMVTGSLGEFGPIILVGVLGLFMILLTIPLMLNQREDPLKKLKRANEPTSGEKPKKERLRQTGRNEQLQKFATFLEPQNEDELSAIQLKLRQAGYQSKDAVRFFHFAQFALGILGLIGGVIYIAMLSSNGQELDNQKMIMYVIGPGGVGYMLPKYWITRRVAARKEAIEQGFPDALDMLLVCVEAGQSLDQSIVRVAKELHASYPDLAEEFEVVAYEMKAGKEKSSVLRDMGTRCGVQDVSSFVTVMIQSATFGTSIAEALRVYASEMRDKRVMRAEEAANKLPTKMTLATMGLTVPPLLIILVSPSAQGIANLGKMGNQ
ncbi:type II secretion system F family protein [Sedimentitalea arenosa]|jgi:tight adherence protein C|uniref:Type II secretion system F family protein n=1 Tax=Sedimentitalea arenosa TaxID=2798803 RepID=A0A8J7JFY8_9RHOB|nr:type II secretion system F family protein [Arenibacterium arenosum]MBJ6370969.1 type II secretion system F family protein [Arenibacterium arenosum]